VQEVYGEKGVGVNVQNVREVTPTGPARADLQVFSSPGQTGKPIGRVRHFVAKRKLPAGTKAAMSQCR